MSWSNRSPSTRMQKAIQARDVAIAARRVALAGAQQELLRLRRDRNFNPMIVAVDSQPTH